jgi:hypothetical protein
MKFAVLTLTHNCVSVLQVMSQSNTVDKCGRFRGTYHSACPWRRMRYVTDTHGNVTQAFNSAVLSNDRSIASSKSSAQHRAI